MTELKPQYLSVSALTKYIKRKFDLDPHLQRVFVVGEISNYRQRAKHQYFSLKDEQAVISAVMFQKEFSQVKFTIENGMKVLVVGRISVFDSQGTYQIYVESIEPDGIGSLYLALEELKKKFKEAGLFDLPKKTLPLYPRNIAVITSRSGSVIHDIRTTLERRNPIVQYELFEAKVQGKEASKEIVHQFDQIKVRQNEFDLVILARGGGSLEDLWCFNDEDVAKAIIACPLPVISSIGHETDTTIADLVADVRAATPTAAAELAAPRLLDIKEKLYQLEQELYYKIEYKVSLLQSQLKNYQETPVLKHPQRIYESHVQKLDYVEETLKSNFQHYIQQTIQKFQWLTSQIDLTQMNQQIEAKQGHLDTRVKILSQAFKHNFEQICSRFDKQTHLLDAHSPLKILTRGYAIVTKSDKIVNSIQDVNQNDSLTVNVIDGQLNVRVEDIKSTSRFNQIDLGQKE